METYRNIDGINVEIDGIVWESPTGGLPFSESYSIGFATLEQNGAVSPVEGGWIFERDTLERLLMEMLAEDYDSEVSSMFFDFTVREGL